MDIKALHNAQLKFGVDNGNFPSKLYKFRDINKRTIQIIKKLEFYFASPLSFNDPFDCNLYYKEKYSQEEIDIDFRRYIENNPDFTYEYMKDNIGLNSKEFYEHHSKINNKMITECGILSLSKAFNNITMWSHYSNNHKGLVFELDIKEDLDFFYISENVKYQEEYEILSFSKSNEEELKKLFLIKYIDWKYEKEVRVIDLKRNGNRKFKKRVLRTIIFGYKTNLKDMKEIIRLCNKYDLNHVKFKKAKLVPGKFALDFDVINKEEFL